MRTQTFMESVNIEYHFSLSLLRRLFLTHFAQIQKPFAYCCADFVCTNCGTNENMVLHLLRLFFGMCVLYILYSEAKIGR